jgi:FkbM family methyltransferase
MKLVDELGRIQHGLTFSGGIPHGHRLALRFAASHYLGVGSARRVTTLSPAGSRMTQPVYALGALFEVLGANLYNLPADFGDAPVVVDIGGHVGAFTVAVCEAYPAAQCFVYEPAPDTCAFLRTNVEQNGLSNRVRVQQAAVAGHAGEASMDIGTPAASAHRPISFGAAGSRSVTVPVRAFADVITAVGRDIDVLKLDCEGSEYSIIEETTAADWQPIRRVVMEYHPDDPERLRALVARMQGFGFRLTGKWRWRYSDDLLGMFWWARPGYEGGFEAPAIGRGADHLPDIPVAAPQPLEVIRPAA